MSVISLIKQEQRSELYGHIIRFSVSVYLAADPQPRGGDETSSAYFAIDPHHTPYRFNLVDTALKRNLAARHVEFFTRQQS